MVEDDLGIFSLVMILPLTLSDENLLFQQPLTPVVAALDLHWDCLAFDHVIFFLDPSSPLVLTHLQTPFSLFFSISFILQILAPVNATIHFLHAHSQGVEHCQRYLYSLMKQYHPLIAGIGWALIVPKNSLCHQSSSFSLRIYSQFNFFLLNILFVATSLTLRGNIYHQWELSLFIIPLLYKLHSS